MRLLPETLSTKRPQKFFVEEQLELPNIPHEKIVRSKVEANTHDEKMLNDPLGR